MSLHSKSFLTGSRDTLPLIIAAAPFGLVYGALAINQGLSEALVMAMSLFVFAGASQFVAITLLASGTAFPVILATVFIVNLRHMLYSASFMPQLAKVSAWLRIPMAFWLTDETFAVVSNRVYQVKNDDGFTAYYLGSAISMYSSWAFFSWLGMTLGQEIPDITSWGLDVAMVVAFVTIIVPLLKNYADWACALTAGVSAVLTYHWPHQTSLLFSSVLAIGVGVFLGSQQLNLSKQEIKDND
jgi:4-azaleucine resistance transporter AzlC